MKVLKGIFGANKLSFYRLEGELRRERLAYATVDEHVRLLAHLVAVIQARDRPKLQAHGAEPV